MAIVAAFSKDEIPLGNRLGDRDKEIEVMQRTRAILLEEGYTETQKASFLPRDQQKILFR